MFLLIDQMRTRIDQGETTLGAVIYQCLYRAGLDEGVVSCLTPARLTFVICFDVG